MSSLEWFFIALLAGYLVEALFYKRLKSIDPNLWQALGQPTLAHIFGIGGQLSMFKFIFSFRYLKLREPILSILGLLVFLLAVSTIVLFVLMIQI